MKKVFITVIVFMLAMPTFLNAQIVVDKSFKTFNPKTETLHNRALFEAGNHILPVTLEQRISGLSVSGHITFTGEMGFVRIVLRDGFEDDYLVLETNTIFENKTDIPFDAFCEETALLNNVLPKQILIECTDAQITLNEIQYTTDNEYRTNKDKQIKEEQLNAKLEHINTVLAQKKITWGAGKTSVSKMSYMEKKDLFGGKLPNLAGFDYYIAGIYVTQGYKPDENRNGTRSQFVPEFDWRNRHGRNWITPVKNQGSCGSCWAFSAVGTVEAYVNLYFNQLLNLDLSEQEMLACTNGGNGIECDEGDFPINALVYMKVAGIVDEECFPYVASDVPCSDKCPDTSVKERIRITYTHNFNPNLETPDDLKKLVIQSPTTFGMRSWSHALVLVGYKTIEEGDTILIPTETITREETIDESDSLIGSTAWILKNSWGTGGSYGDGFLQIVTTWDDLDNIHSIYGKVTRLNHPNTEVTCEDRDGDGYYYWGVGPKPATCPECAPDEPDGDDSNPNLGPMDEYGNCAVITSATSITTSQTWNAGIINSDITIQPNVTLTITGTVYCAKNVSITIQPGGKLVINGGKLTNSCPDKMWEGIIVLGNKNERQLAQYQGTVELKNGAVIEHAIRAIKAASAGDESINGGIIKATDAIFRNDLWSIEYCSYENHNSNGTIIDNVGKFTNCTFTIDNNNRFAANGHNFQHHVTMWAVRGVTFEGCLFESSSTLYKGMGIYTEDAGFKIINYCDPDFVGPGIDCACPSNHTNKPTTFKNQGYGIASDNTGNPRHIHIDQSKFQDVYYGALLSVQNNYRLTRCDFSNIYSYGLQSLHSSGYRIEENDFSSYSPNNATGILMNNSGSASNRIYKNHFTGFNKGISIQSINGPDPNSIFLKSQGLQLICNDFINNTYDVDILPNATIGLYQGNISSGADNDFIASQVSSFYSTVSYYQAVTYYHSPGNDHAPYNPIINIIVNNNAAPNPCASTFCTGGGDIDTKSFLDSLEHYKAMQQQYDEWLAQLPENPELLQELLSLSDAMRELSDHAISRILGDSILYLEALKPWYEVVRTPIAKYALAEVYFYERKYDQAEVVLREIPALFAFDESEMTEHANYMQFYNFKKQLQLAERTWPQLNENEIAQLQTIAEATKGRSASMAKGVLCFFFDICYEDEIEEGEEGEEVILTKNTPTETQPSGIQDQDLTYELFLYPNPTQSEMTVALNNPALKIVQMEIYDVTGRKLRQQTVNQSYGTLKMSELDQGIYILKVRLEHGDVVVRKVVRN